MGGNQEDLELLEGLKFRGHLAVTGRTWSWGEDGVIERTLKVCGIVKQSWDLHAGIWPVSPEGRLLDLGLTAGHRMIRRAAWGQSQVWGLGRGQGQVLT